MSIIEDPKAQEDLQALARRYNQEATADRGMDTEAQVLEVIRDLATSAGQLSVKEIANWFADRHGAEYERKVTPRWIGSILRKKLQLRPERVRGVFVVPASARTKLERLYEKYGITSTDEGSGEPSEWLPRQ